MKIHINLNKSAIMGLEKAVHDSALESMQLLKQDLVFSTTMPFDTGDLQNNQTFVSDNSDEKIIDIRLEHCVNWARYLYYGMKMVDSETGKSAFPIFDDTGNQIGFRHRKNAVLIATAIPLKFQQGKNSNAGAEWLEPYINGNKKTFIHDKFTELLREKI